MTGFLDAGKTSLLNTLFRRRRAEGASICCIQFECGEEELILPAQGTGGLDTLRFSIRELQGKDGPAGVSRQIYNYLLRHEPDEVWVEWNGVAPASLLPVLFPSPKKEGTGTPGDFCRIRKVIHIADAGRLEALIAQTGGVVLDQILNCDLVILRHFDSAAHFRRLKRSLRELNPGIKVLPLKPLHNVTLQLKKPAPKPNLAFLLGILFFAAAYLVLRFGMGLHGVSPDTVVNTFLGILLQGVPFLLIGVLLSSAIQIFVPQQFIERCFPKNLAGGMAFAILAGFCLPVCDCASIPVFRSLVRKGVPLASAVTFMAATPVINPVVILSTWHAFNGNWAIVLCRVALGILCAVLVGLTFAGRDLKRGDMSGGLGGKLCACGCYSGAPASDRCGKALLYLRHAQSEFFNVGKYLMLGAFVSALFQTLCGSMSWKADRGGLLVSILLMMGMAFLLSLCSSSDAVVARSFAGQFPTGALMAFLVFGPMMDIKNVILLSSSFSKRFVLRLSLTMFLACALVVFFAFHFGLERILV